MKDWKLIFSHFYLFMSVAALLALLDVSARIFYVCNKVTWLEWSIKGAYPTMFGFLLLIGFPWWLGVRCKLCSQRNVFLFGVLFNLGIGIVGDIVSALQWQFFLTRCMPVVYATAGGWQAIIIAWLVLPIEALLGGLAALIGQKWSSANFDKTDKKNKKTLEGENVTMVALSGKSSAR